MSAQSAVQTLRVRRAPGRSGRTIWLTGLPSAGKTTIARALAARLVEPGRPVEVLDGDEARKVLTAGLGLQPRRPRRERAPHRLRGRSAQPQRRRRRLRGDLAVPRRARRGAGRHAESTPDEPDRFVEVWVSTPVDVCADRDVKGLYARQRAGEISGLTGVDDPYEAPHAAELELRTDELDLDECVERILAGCSPR